MALPLLIVLIALLLWSLLPDPDQEPESAANRRD